MKMTAEEFLEDISRLDDTCYLVMTTGKFEKSLARSYRRNYDLEELKNVVQCLAM